VVVDPEVAQMVGELARKGGRHLDAAGLDKDPRAIRAVEVRLIYMLICATVRAEIPDLMDLDRLQAFTERESVLDAAAFADFFDGICPISPFCC